jgi:negative regulator of flagellin synthesis FlgM
MRKEAAMGITAIGASGLTRAVDLLRGDAPVRTAAAAPGPRTDETAPTTPAAQLAAAGAPIDASKVASLRQAIAEGRYSVDPQRIADAMVALDLPAKS